MSRRRHIADHWLCKIVWTATPLKRAALVLACRDHMTVDEIALATNHTRLEVGEALADMLIAVAQAKGKSIEHKKNAHKG